MEDLTAMSICPWVTVQYDKFLYHLQTSKFYLISVHQCHLYMYYILNYVFILFIFNLYCLVDLNSLFATILAVVTDNTII